MAGNDRFDDSIGRWLEEAAPNRLPQRVLGATFELTRRTQQEPRWGAVLRRLQMPRFIPALGGAAIVVVATVLAINVIPFLGLGGPPTPSPSPSSSTFSSTIHGISMDYPSGWQVRPATEPWTGGELSFNSPAADVIFDPALGARVYVVLASRSLGSLSDDDWRNEEFAWLCTGGGEFWGFTVDGVPAQAHACTGSRFAALIPKDGRGYLIRLMVQGEGLGAYDFDHWLKPFVETVDLRPEAAIDEVGPSE